MKSTILTTDGTSIDLTVQGSQYTISQGSDKVIFYAGPRETFTVAGVEDCGVYDDEHRRILQRILLVSTTTIVVVLVYANHGLEIRVFKADWDRAKMDVPSEVAPHTKDIYKDLTAMRLSADGVEVAVSAILSDDEYDSFMDELEHMSEYL